MQQRNATNINSLLVQDRIIGPRHEDDGKAAIGGGKLAGEFYA